MNGRLQWALSTVFLIIMAIFFLAPIIWMIDTSFKTPFNAFIIPPQWIPNPFVLQSWQELFQAGYVWHGEDILRTYLPNSLIDNIGATFLTLVLSIPPAYSIARYQFYGKRVLALSTLGSQLLPPVALIIPMYLTFDSWHLLDTNLVLILVYTAFNIPIATWLMRSFIASIPAVIEDSSLVDGYSRFGTFLRVTLPLILPGIAATSIFIFLLSWNDFTMAFFLTGSRGRTMVPLAAGFRSEAGTFWGPAAAYGVIMIIPALIFVFFVQRYIVRGLTMGAAKGV